MPRITKAQLVAENKRLKEWAAELQRRVDYLMPKPLPYGTSVCHHPNEERPAWMGPLVEPSPDRDFLGWACIQAGDQEPQWVKMIDRTNKEPSHA